MQVALSRIAVLAALGGNARVRALSTVSAKNTAISLGLADSRSDPLRGTMPEITAWSRTASVNQEGDVKVACVTEQELLYNQAGNRVLDLTKGTDWMEFLEQKEGRQDDEGGAGAYDVMRCDVMLPIAEEDSAQDVRIWGEDFHLKRLQSSYRSLLEAQSSAEDGSQTISKQSIREAVNQTKKVISKLLHEAKLSVTARRASEDLAIELFRLTLLWSKEKSTDDSASDGIVVRGHVATSTKIMKVLEPPDRIIASVASYSPDLPQDSETLALESGIPSRYTNPQSKIASWCRLRQAMERPETFMPPGVSEVLMVRPRIDGTGNIQLEVLEGLSSNFFVITKDEKLQTATEGILNGYVRHLVLDCASKLGLKFDPRPILLNEASNWKEAFITSSSRLIYPISEIKVRDHAVGEANTFITHWKEEIKAGDTPKWQELLDEVLALGGYPTGSSRTDMKDDS